MISQVESLLCPDKQGSPEKDWRIQRLKHCVSTDNNKDENNCSKNHNQNNELILKDQRVKQIVNIYLCIYNNEHKDQKDIKKKSKCEINFYFKVS